MPKHANPKPHRVVRVPRPISQDASGSNNAGEGSSAIDLTASSSTLSIEAQRKAGREAAIKLGWIATPASATRDSSAHTSTAEWNSLLTWARRQRGPQWDEATAIWQVDRYSPAYYSFASRPAFKTVLDTAPARASDPQTSRIPKKPTDTAAVQRTTDSGDAEGAQGTASDVNMQSVDDVPGVKGSSSATEDLTSLDSALDSGGTGMAGGDDSDANGAVYPSRRNARRDTSPPAGSGRAAKSRRL